VKNEFELDSHLYGFIAIIATLVYCIMEEYGWRGYLQEELKPLKSWKTYLINRIFMVLMAFNFFNESK